MYLLPLRTCYFQLTLISLFLKESLMCLLSYRRAILFNEAVRSLMNVIIVDKVIIISNFTLQLLVRPCDYC